MSTQKTIENTIQNAASFADKIEDSTDKLYRLLEHYETHETIQDEIVRSVEALRNLQDELTEIESPLQGLTISTFFPLNLPLYSLVLFGVAPSMFASAVYIRPPEVMYTILKQLWDLLDIPHYFPNISHKELPRHIFMDLYATESDVIIFTGKYENALAIQEQCPHALLLYNGSGVNPFVLFDDADVDLAVEKAVEMRCFNSGQDCAGPDAFFVPKHLTASFSQKLQATLDKVNVGESTDPNVRVSHIMKESYIFELEEWLVREQRHLIYGGRTDAEHHFIHPTVLQKSIREHDGDYHEFFGPVFYILEYEEISELETALLDPLFVERTMYISTFGSNPELEAKLTFAKILKNEIINDIERGNTEYGGYGAKANFMLYGDTKTVKPILISRDLHLGLR